MTLLFSDNFNRANGGPGSNYTAYAVAGSIISNQYTANASGSLDAWNGGTPVASCYIKATLATIPTGADFISIGLRFTPATYNGYYICADSGQLTIKKIVNGTDSVIGAAFSLPAAGTVIELRAVGTSLSLYYDGALQGSRTDSTFGAAGSAVIFGVGTSGRLDNLEIGNDSRSGCAVAASIANAASGGILEERAGSAHAPSAASAPREATAAAVARADAPSTAAAPRTANAAGAARADGASSGTAASATTASQSGSAHAPSYGFAPGISATSRDGRADAPSSAAATGTSTATQAGRADASSSSLASRTSLATGAGRSDASSGATAATTSSVSATGRADSPSSAAGGRATSVAATGRAGSASTAAAGAASSFVAAGRADATSAGLAAPPSAVLISRLTLDIVQRTSSWRTSAPERAVLAYLYQQDGLTQCVLPGLDQTEWPAYCAFVPKSLAASIVPLVPVVPVSISRAGTAVSGSAALASTAAAATLIVRQSLQVIQQVTTWRTSAPERAVLAYLYQVDGLTQCVLPGLDRTDWPQQPAFIAPSAAPLVATLMALPPSVAISRSGRADALSVALAGTGLIAAGAGRADAASSATGARSSQAAGAGRADATSASGAASATTAQAAGRAVTLSLALASTAAIVAGTGRADAISAAAAAGSANANGTGRADSPSRAQALAAALISLAGTATASAAAQGGGASLAAAPGLAIAGSSSRGGASWLDAKPGRAEAASFTFSPAGTTRIESDGRLVRVLGGDRTLHVRGADRTVFVPSGRTESP